MMTTKHLLAFAAIGALTLSACDRIKAPEQPAAPAATTETPTVAETPAEPNLPVRPEAVESTAGIDWEAARRDMASVPSEERGEGAFQVQSGASAPPVPVLLPTGIVVPQSAEGGVKFMPMSDGYFATYPGVDYDIVVNGTNEVIGARDAGDTSADPFSTTSFASTMSGAGSLSADLVIAYLPREIDCRGSDQPSAVLASTDHAAACSSGTDTCFALLQAMDIASAVFASREELVGV